MNSQQQPLVEFRHITKRFPGVTALSDISLSLQSGEVHVLIGENGAGKSTLMKVLSGAYSTDEGELLIDGESIKKNSQAISEKLGIGMIYQELNLIPELSIMRNIFLLSGCHFLLLNHMPYTVKNCLSLRSQ